MDVTCGPPTPRKGNTVTVSANKEIKAELHCSVKTRAFRRPNIFPRAPEVK
jgi:hypothetical protein